MIMSDCKSCVLFLCKKKTSGADEGHILSTEVWLVLTVYAPTSKNLEGHIVFALFVISFVFFSVSRGLKHLCVCVCVGGGGGGGKDIKNLINKYLHIYVLSFTPCKTI